MPNSSQPLVRTRGDRRTLEFATGDIQSEMRLSRPSALVLAYARAMMGFALFVPRPRHILMIGLGGGSMAKFCHRHFPDARITVLELRADVIALREQFLVPPDDARFRVVHADAADWLARAARHGPLADAIVIDGFDEDGLPPALSSLPFYRDCRRLLLPGGVLAANVFSYDPRQGAVLGALATAFDGRICQLRKVAGNNRILFAVGSPDGPDDRAARMQRRLARHGALLPVPGRGLFNRLCIWLLLNRLAWRSVLA
jgi:spermidine synthase